MTLLTTLLVTLLVKDNVPQPVYAADTALVSFYYKAWEIAEDHIRTEPGLANERYMDEGCMEENGLRTIWVWDTAFMSLFCKYAPSFFPGIESLQNFYAPILDGRPSPLRIQHPDNPPLFSWVEYDYYKFTADKAHLDTLVLENKYLQRYYDYFNTLDDKREFSFGYRPVKLRRHEIGFEWDGNQSGMDNTPRNRDGEILWVDAISQQALSALYISRLARICSDYKTSRRFAREYRRLKWIINRYYWSEADSCYYDIRMEDNRPTRILTPASFWPMLAEIPCKRQAEKMARFALSATRLGGDYPWKSLSALDEDYVPEHGRYWRGAVWLPTAYMGIKSLEKYGLRDLANETAERLLEQMKRTYLSFEPHSIWECYSPSADRPANSKRKDVVRKDFCGWSALGPISLFIENVIGIYEVDAAKAVVRWDIHHDFEHGVRNLQFGDTTADLIYRDGTITVSTNNAFTLYAGSKKYKLKAGNNVLNIR